MRKTWAEINARLEEKATRIRRRQCIYRRHEGDPWCHRKPKRAWTTCGAHYTAGRHTRPDELQQR